MSLRIRVSSSIREAQLICLLLCLAVPTTASPQTEVKLPTTSEVLQRYIDVTGGKEALLRHKSMTVRGRYRCLLRSWIWRP